MSTQAYDKDGNKIPFAVYKGDIVRGFQTVEQYEAQIASLTVEIDRLREALSKIADGTAFSLIHPVPIYGMGSDLEDGYFIAADFARAALQPKEGEG